MRRLRCDVYSFDYIFSLVLFIFFFLVCFVLPIVDPLLSVAFARFVGRGPVRFPLRDPFFRGVSSVRSRFRRRSRVAADLVFTPLRPTFDPFGGLGGGRGTVAATTGGAVFLPRVDPFSGICSVIDDGDRCGCFWRGCRRFFLGEKLLPRRRRLSLRRRRPISSFQTFVPGNRPYRPKSSRYQFGRFCISDLSSRRR